MWRQQAFSNLMLGLLGAGGRAPAADAFAHRLRRARLDQVLRDPQLSRWFARAYAGVDD